MLLGGRSSSNRPSEVPVWLQTKEPKPKRAIAQLLWVSLGVLLAGVALVWGPSRLEDNKSTIVLLLLLAICFTSLFPLFSNTAYGPATDILLDDKHLRGACEAKGDEELSDLVRALYQFCSYDSVQTIWPIVVFFSMISAIVCTSLIGEHTTWFCSALIVFVTIVLAFMFVSGFVGSHGQLQAQMYRDAIYCRYRVVEAMQKEDGQATKERHNSS